MRVKNVGDRLHYTFAATSFATRESHTDSIPAHNVARAHAVTVATRIRPPVSFRIVAAIGLVLLHPGLAPAAGGLAADDVQQLRRFERTGGLRDIPEWARDKEKSGVQQSGEGWGLIFDPIGSAIVAALIAMVLGLLDGLLPRRLGPAEPPR